MISETDYTAPLDTCQCGATIFLRGNTHCPECLGGADRGGDLADAAPVIRQPEAELAFRAARASRQIQSVVDRYDSSWCGLLKRWLGLVDASEMLAQAKVKGPENVAPRCRPANALKPVIYLP